MPVYLDENMLGTDPQLIGFPHLLVCMGLLCMTEQNLYGVHLTEIEDTNTAVDGFRTWLGALGVGGTQMRALYGSANFTVRYRNIAGPHSDLTELWKVEMNRIAGRLGYRGPIYGFDTSIIHPQDGTYVEYRSQLPRTTCRVFYKRHEKMQYTTAQHNAGAPSLAKFNPHTGRIDPAVFIRSSATTQPGSTLREVDYSTRLISYVHI
jgi:hypothetical protein